MIKDNEIILDSDEYEQFINTCNRLAELEDKIKRGELVEVPEGSVVLTKEKLIELNEKGFTFDTTTGKKINLIEMAREIERKEAVKEFATNFENHLCDVNNDYCTDDTVLEALYTSAEIDKVMDKTLKDFGVEVL